MHPPFSQRFCSSTGISFSIPFEVSMTDLQGSGGGCQMTKKKKKFLHLFITPKIEESPDFDLRHHLWIPYPGDMETMEKIRRERSL